MRYYEVDFTIKAQPEMMQTARDLLSATAAEAGFETFTETAHGLTGYVQTTLFDEPLLRQELDGFILDDVSISYDVHEAENRNWNEQWEQEGFEPIIVGEQCAIHDGRHLPATPYPLSIEIDARQAFGTGTHETTRMIVATLLNNEMKGRRVLDCGCGTGILSIVALKLGAQEATGYDIDEWSYDNARHNAVINHVDDRFTPLLGDASVLDQTKGTFDVVLANINRNILLQDLPAFRRKMADGAMLVLSGFYTADAPMLIGKAHELQLTLSQQLSDHDWCCLVFHTAHPK